MKKGDHLFLVDGSGYIFRAYHALPPLTRKSDGLPVGAVSGFCNMLWKLMVSARDTDVGVVPSHFKSWLGPIPRDAALRWTTTSLSRRKRT